MFCKGNNMILLVILALIGCGLYFFVARCSKCNVVCCQKKNNKKVSFFIVDVLDKDIHDDVHIEGAIQVDYMQMSSFLHALDTNTILVFYCANYRCTASDDAAKLAAEMGFKKVYLYKGGIAEWYQKSKTDKRFTWEGPALSPWLEVVILPSVEDDNQNISGVTIIDAEDLLKMREKSIIEDKI